MSDDLNSIHRIKSCEYLQLRISTNSLGLKLIKFITNCAQCILTDIDFSMIIQRLH